MHTEGKNTWLWRRYNYSPSGGSPKYTLFQRADSLTRRIWHMFHTRSNHRMQDIYRVVLANWLWSNNGSSCELDHISVSSAHFLSSLLVYTNIQYHLKLDRYSAKHEYTHRIGTPTVTARDMIINSSHSLSSFQWAWKTSKKKNNFWKTRERAKVDHECNLSTSISLHIERPKAAKNNKQQIAEHLSIKQIQHKLKYTMRSSQHDFELDPNINFALRWSRCTVR